MSDANLGLKLAHDSESNAFLTNLTKEWGWNLRYLKDLTPFMQATFESLDLIEIASQDDESAKKWDRVFAGMWSATHLQPVKAERCTVAIQFRLSTTGHHHSDSLRSDQYLGPKALEKALRARGYSVVAENEQPEFLMRAWLSELNRVDGIDPDGFWARLSDRIMPSLDMGAEFTGFDEHGRKIKNRFSHADARYGSWNWRLRRRAKGLIPDCVRN